MTWTLSHDNPARDRYYRATRRRSPRFSTGRVVYPPEFARLARPVVGHTTSGDGPVAEAARTAARGPAVPLSLIERASIYYMEHEWVASVIVGFAIAGFAVIFAAWIVL